MREPVCRERIKKLLDEQYLNGEISITEYEYGMDGLPLVHTMIEAGQQAEAISKEPNGGNEEVDHNKETKK